MTEAEWLACEDPQKMLEFLRGKVSDRKLRLFAVACCYSDCRKRLKPEFEAVVRFADGQASLDEIRSYWARGFSSAYVSWPEQPFAWASRFVRVPDLWEDSLDEGPIDACKATQLLRCIFGPLPFRCHALDHSWLTSTVTSLATAIYNERAFDRLPILADALEDTGCTQQDILSHLRSGGEHTRGCWPLDLVLGKE